MTVGSPWARLIAIGLAARGVDVHVIDCSPRNLADFLDEAQEKEALVALRPHVASVHRVPTPRAYPLQVTAAGYHIRKLVAACGANVMLSLYGGATALAAWMSGRRPYVVYVMGSDVLLADRLRRLIARISLGGASLVLANGKHLAARTRSMVGSSGVENLYLGIDLSRFGGNLMSLAPRFVCTRVFRSVYDNATIVRAIAALPDPPSDFAMTFMSAGPDWEKTRALAASLLSSETQARVSWYGWASETQLVEALRNASFYISASLSDGTSQSLLEAMAAGLLPIVSDIPANREWIEHGRNGLLFPPRDAAALAACMTQAMSRPAWIEGARQDNYRIVAAEANVDVTMNTLLRRLDSLRCSSSVSD
jgi:L-malate glycosyltransferase